MDDERYYRRKPKKFLDATIGWGWELKGIYSILIDIIMLGENDLPDDAGYISGHLGCTKNRWTIAKKQLIKLGKIEIVDEKIVQSTAKLEQNFRKSKSKQAAVNRSNPNKNKGNTDTVETHRDRDRDRDRDKKDTPRGVCKKPPQKPKRKTTIRQDWMPEPLQPKTLAKITNLTTEEKNDELDKFRDYHTAEQTLSGEWNANWRKWISDQGKYKRERGNIRANGKQSSAANLAQAFDEVGAGIFTAKG